MRIGEKPYKNKDLVLVVSSEHLDMMGRITITGEIYNYEQRNFTHDR